MEQDEGNRRIEDKQNWTNRIEKQKRINKIDEQNMTNRIDKQKTKKGQIEQDKQNRTNGIDK